MRQLLPEPLDAPDLSVLDDRSDRTAPSTRPWVMGNMVMSIDGAYAVDGRSGGLGTPADREVFHRLRAAADVILVAAGTARAERYRLPRLDEAAVQRRRALGWADQPRLALVSRRLELPTDLPLLSGDGQVPLVLAPAGADTSALPEGVEVRTAGDGPGVDLGLALALLRDDGARVVLTEGGPNLLGQLHRAGLLDELFVTLSPALVGGTTVGLLGPGPALLQPMRLHRLLEDDGALFATYRRA